MKTCPQCGRLIPDTHAQFCPSCGFALQPEQPSQAEHAEYAAPTTHDSPTTSLPPYGGMDGAPSTPQPTYPIGYAPYAPPQSPYGAPPTMPYAPPQSPYAYGAPPSAPSSPQPPYGPAYGAPGVYPGAYMPGANWRPGSEPEQRPWGRIVGGVLGALALIAILAGVVYSASRLHSHAHVMSNGTATGDANSANTILADSLMSNTNGWSDDATHCYFAPDGYHIRDSYLCYAPIGIQTDGTESVTAKEVSGPTNHGYGLIFRRASKGNYYMFIIDSDSKWAVGKVVNGTTSTLQEYTTDAAIKGGLNTANLLSVTMAGSTFAFYANGVKLGTIHDSTFTKGKWGLVAFSTDNVVFTNYLARR
ncbi:MAG TPA: hypothetical protein VF812_12380 [Ktedonobacterales bacterium]